MWGKVSRRKLLSSTPMSAPSSLCSFITPAKTRGADTAAVTAPNIEATLLAEEQQVQWDADDLVKVLKDVIGSSEVRPDDVECLPAEGLDIDEMMATPLL